MHIININIHIPYNYFITMIMFLIVQILLIGIFEVMFLYI
jgi:hypothetical protein